SHKPLSALLLDVDYFKQINDSYGHGVGDQVLRKLAEQFTSVLRENDIVGRWGGEEFFILLRDCPRENAVTLAQKLRSLLASQPLLASHPQLQVTISLGVVEHRSGESLGQL